MLKLYSESPVTPLEGFEECCDLIYFEDNTLAPLCSFHIFRPSVVL